MRETLNADLPLAIDHFRYFGSVIRGEAGDVCNLDADTVSMEVHEPLGVVGQIIPWNFPILMAAWKLAPALAAGNCVVIKAASQTPVGILLMMELIADILPPGTVNVVSGFGAEVGKPLAMHPGIKKVGFTGETTTGRLIMQYASENIIPVTLELGGKSPNVFLESVMAADDDFLDKAVEGPRSSPSTRAKSAPVPPAHWSTSGFTTASWIAVSSGSRPSRWAIRSTRPR